MTALAREVIGYSVEARPIEAQLTDPWMNGAADLRTLVIGGMHGDEAATIELVRNFHPRAGAAAALLPVANPDGAERAIRYNARGVDLNRNFAFNWRPDGIEPGGRAPWSEPETCALRDFILAWKPTRIVSLHWALAEIDADGSQSRSLAEAMWRALDETERSVFRMRVTDRGEAMTADQWDAQCPGSLGQWAGYGLFYGDGSQPAMITLELPYDPVAIRPERLPDDHLATVHEAWKRDPKAYLETVGPAVERMLHAACSAAAAAPAPDA